VCKCTFGTEDSGGDGIVVVCWWWGSSGGGWSFQIRSLAKEGWKWKWEWILWTLR
jgi:hypothetical protein